MKVISLSTTSYPQTRRAIDDMTIEMYQEVTSALLHDDSPIKVASDIKDIWEVVAQSLYDNNNITHRQFLKCIARIVKVLEEAFESLGAEEIEWDFE